MATSYNLQKAKMKKPENPAHSPHASRRTESTQLNIMSISKLLIMGCLSLGFYFTYWNYRHWLLIRGQPGFRLVPLLCTIFGGFTLYWLMKNIVARSREANVTVEGTALSITLMWWLPSLAIMGWGLWISELYIGSLPLSVAYLTPIMLVFTNLLFSTIALIQIQQAANACGGEPLGLQNSTITWANVLWVIISWVPIAAISGYVVAFDPLMYFMKYLS